MFNMVFNEFMNKTAGGGTRSRAATKVADQTWIVTALLHREHPDHEDFSVREIVQRAAKEAIGGELRPSLHVHAIVHCVANRSPNPGRYRMLLATSRDRRRLFRPGDPYHPDREGSKTVPEKADIPAKYHRLIDWYSEEYVRQRPARGKRPNPDPVLMLRGLGKEIWGGEHPDRYVRRLREGWS